MSDPATPPIIVFSDRHVYTPLFDLLIFGITNVPSFTVPSSRPSSLVHVMFEAGLLIAVQVRVTLLPSSTVFPGVPSMLAFGLSEITRNSNRGS